MPKLTTNRVNRRSEELDDDEFSTSFSTTDADYQPQSFKLSPSIPDQLRALRKNESFGYAQPLSSRDVRNIADVKKKLNQKFGPAINRAKGDDKEFAYSATLCVFSDGSLAAVVKVTRTE